MLSFNLTVTLPQSLVGGGGRWHTNGPARFLHHASHLMKREPGPAYEQGSRTDLASKFKRESGYAHNPPPGSDRGPTLAVVRIKKSTRPDP
jgi:hypothetical protein